MKSLSQYILESLNFRKIDSEQIFFLYTNKIDIKTLSINCNISEKDAEWIKSVLDSENIIIVSTDQMLDKYDKDKVSKIIDNIDKYVDAGVRYGNEIGLTDKEKKERAEIEKGMGIEPKEDLGDEELVKQVVSDFTSIDPKYIQEFFWKKSGESGYLFFILDNNDEIKKFIKKI